MSGCDSTTTPRANDPRAADHPCFSESAHLTHARIHLAVAPACNMQCHYCNRAFDCANESRPGVASTLSTPSEAVARLEEMVERLPTLSVAGIAGPGDPLANPEATFLTFRLIKERFPKLKLCLSTNGLNLPKHLETIRSLGIDHVTVTLNTLDPEVGTRIYPWIFYNQRRWRGIEAARILLEQQQAGVAELTAHGVLVKLNSVLIPGLNAGQMPVINRWAKAQGVFLHNILPLLSHPSHGTYFGLTGQREPSSAELEQVRAACGDARLMTHCRQCRADAAGLIGDKEPASASSPPQTRRVITIQSSGSSHSERLVAVAVDAQGMVNPHFGHTERFQIYRLWSGGCEQLPDRLAGRYCVGPEGCGDHEATLQATVKALAGVHAVLCARIGFTPWQALLTAGIQPDNSQAGVPVATALEYAWHRYGPRQQRLAVAS